MTDKFYTTDQVRKLTKRQLQKDSLEFWCFVKGISLSEVSEFMLGKNKAPKGLLDALGLEYRIARKRQLDED